MSIKSFFHIVFLSIGLHTAITAQFDPNVLMTVGDTPVTLEEFKYIYEKNNGAEADYSRKSLQDYKELYIKFKLKVNEARAQKLDTIKSLKEELNGYKSQLTNSYLMDKEVLERLVNEVYERSATDVNVAHIYFQLSAAFDQETTKNIEKKAADVHARLLTGADFEELAREYSDDRASAENGGELGYFTAMMPSGFYNFETAMYNTPVGSITGPVRTRMGLHILKVLDKRPARGEIEVAHIMIRKDNDNAVALINMVHSLLQEGQSFKELVRSYSQDENTSSNGGLLPVFGINVYEKTFEDAAFALQAPGEFSKPIETSAGYHIISLIRKINTDDYNTFRKKTEPKIKRDERYTLASKSLIEKIKKDGKFKENSDLFNKWTSGLNEEFLSYKWSAEYTDLYPQTLISFDNNFKYTLGDFAAFCRKNTKTRLKYEQSSSKPADVARVLLDEFSDQKAIEFEQHNLENKYTDFKNLMREYEEGILLFEVTKILVWDKANTDTIGLFEFYEINKDKYLWEEKAVLSTYFVNTDDSKVIAEVQKFAKKNPAEKVLKKFNKKSELITYTEEELERSHKSFAGMDWTAGYITLPAVDHKNKKTAFKKIEKIIPSKRKTLKEARGYVVADYQDKLEKQWVQNLRSKYLVRVNNELFEQIIKK